VTLVLNYIILENNIIQLVIAVACAIPGASLRGVSADVRRRIDPVFDSKAYGRP